MIEKDWKAGRIDEYLLEYRQHSNEQANNRVNYGLELAHYRRQLKAALEQNAVFRKALVALQTQRSPIPIASGCPVSVEKELERVKRFLMDEKYDDAIRSLVALFKEFPEQSTLYRYFALALAKKGDLQSAESAMKYAIFHDPSLSTAYNDMGVIKHQLGKKADASAYYKKAIAISPDNVSAVKNLADHLLFEDHQPEEALKLYLNAHEQDRTDLDILLSLGHAYSTLGQVPAAITYYEKVLSLDAGNDTARERLQSLHELVDHELTVS
jgi:tetratricopeptide (TPR) repeat protein